MLTKKDLQHLAGLARLELKENEEDKLLSDMEKILAHFQELNELDTTGVESMTGGVFHKNIFRDDAGKSGLSAEESLKAFPEVDGKFLKIPPVFN
ncbi:MAG: Asp-tRNA(Asn)/Glu-tRNA(Gln) amidotransferase subunit GatC [Patescibacteria group bacterium]